METMRWIFLFLISFQLDAQVFDNTETMNNAKVDRLKNVEDYLNTFSNEQILVNSKTKEMSKKIDSQAKTISALEKKVSDQKKELEMLVQKVDDLTKIITVKNKDGKKLKIVTSEEFDNLKSEFNQYKVSNEKDNKAQQADLKSVQTILIQIEKEKNRLSK